MGRRTTGIEKSSHSEQSVVEPLHLAPQQWNRNDRKDDEVTDANASCEENDSHYERVHHGDRKIGLECDKHVEDSDNYQKRKKAFRQSTESVAFFYHEHRRPHNECE